MTNEEEALFGIDKLNVARSEIPAVTHVDYSARVQTVHADTNPRFHALIARFKAKTGCPVLVNTSFNVRSEPIVCTPEDAFRCFMGNEIELLVVGNCMLRKKRAEPGAQDRLQGRVRAGLSACSSLLIDVNRLAGARFPWVKSNRYGSCVPRHTRRKRLAESRPLVIWAARRQQIKSPADRTETVRPWKDMPLSTSTLLRGHRG